MKKALSFILKFFKWTFGSVFLLVLLILVAVLVIIWNPHLILNEKTVTWGAEYARRHKIVDLRWKQLRVDARSLSFFKKQLGFDFEGLCVDRPDVNGCFQRFAIATQVDFTGLKPKILEIGPISLLGGDFKVRPDASPKSIETAPSEKKSKPTGESPDLFAQDWIKDAKVREIIIQFAHLDLSMPGKQVVGELELTNDLSHQGARWDLKAKEKFTEKLNGGAASHTGHLEAAVESPTQIWKGPYTLHAKAQANFRDGKEIRVKSQIHQLGETDFKYDLDGSFIQKGQLAVLALKGEYTKTFISGALTGSARNFSVQVPKASIQDCGFRIQQTSQDKKLAQVDLRCPISLKVKVPPIEAVPEFKMPTDTGILLSANLRTSFPPSTDEPVEGQVKLDLDPVLTPLLEGEGHIVSQVKGVPTEFPHQWGLDTQVGIKLKMAKFEDGVDMLRKGAWAVPAPFNALKGPIEMGAMGHLDLNGGQLPIFFRTRLASAPSSQKLNLDGSGAVNFTRDEVKGISSNTKFQLVFSDVQLALPRLNLEAPPRFFPDSRIFSSLKAAVDQLSQNSKEKGKSTKQAAGTKPAAFTYDVSLITPPNHPMKILSNLARSQVPINLNLKTSSSQSMSGSVRIANFPVSFFRRDAEVEKLDIIFDPESEEMKLDGSIRVKYADYLVKILLFGSAKSPQIKLVSEPPVAEKELVAVLLFGHPLSELDESQAESVGNAQAAIADGAVGLASMYALASTPIESIDYNSANRGLTAKVKLGEGTSLNVGGSAGATAQDKSEEHIGIRRRLSRYWTITTEVTKPNDASGSSANAFLEWSNRY